MTASPQHIGGVVSVEARPAAYLRMLRAMFGPPLPGAKSLAEAAWEDDGGTLTSRCEGYEHTIGAQCA